MHLLRPAPVASAPSSVLLLFAPAPSSVLLLFASLSSAPLLSASALLRFAFAPPPTCPAFSALTVSMLDLSVTLVR